MKCNTQFIKRHILVFFLLITVLITTTSFRKGECTTDEMNTEAISRQVKHTILEQFPVYLKKKGKKDPVESRKFMVTMNRGVRYKFYTVRNKEYDGLPVMTIYNNEKMEFMIGCTYNTLLKKFYNELEFECKTTGTYCLAVNFQEGLEGCALGVFASLIK